MARPLQSQAQRNLVPMWTSADGPWGLVFSYPWPAITLTVFIASLVAFALIVKLAVDDLLQELVEEEGDSDDDAGETGGAYEE